MFWAWISEFSCLSLNVALLLVTILTYENLLFLFSLWFCQYRWCIDENNLLTTSSWSVRELYLYLPARSKEFIDCHASLSLLRFGRSKRLPAWIFAGILPQWVCFCCCRQIVMVCRCRTRLLCVPLPTVLSGLVGSLLRWAWGQQGHSLANSPAVVIYWGPSAVCCPSFWFFPAHLGMDIFSYLTPFSLIKLLDVYFWSSQE